MDVSTLHTLTEDLAAFLSEVTQGDLGQPTPGSDGDVGDLYLRLVDQNVSLVTAITGETMACNKWPDPRNRADLDVSADCYGTCGLEVGYRHSARLVENAFTSASDREQLYRTGGRVSEASLTALYETQIDNTVIHTWDIAQALGLSYQPIPNIARRVLQNILLRSTQSTPEARPDADAAVAVDDASFFECILTLSGRGGGRNERRATVKSLGKGQPGRSADLVEVLSPNSG